MQSISPTRCAFGKGSYPLLWLHENVTLGGETHATLRYIEPLTAKRSNFLQICRNQFVSERLQGVTFLIALRTAHTHTVISSRKTITIYAIYTGVVMIPIPLDYNRVCHIIGSVDLAYINQEESKTETSNKECKQQDQLSVSGCWNPPQNLLCYKPNVYHLEAWNNSI